MPINRISKYLCNEQEYQLMDTILEILMRNEPLFLYWSGQEEMEDYED